MGCGHSAAAPAGIPGTYATDAAACKLRSNKHATLAYKRGFAMGNLGPPGTVLRVSDDGNATFLARREDGSYTFYKGPITRFDEHEWLGCCQQSLCCQCCGPRFAVAVTRDPRTRQVVGITVDGVALHRFDS